MCGISEPKTRNVTTWDMRGIEGEKKRVCIEDIVNGVTWNQLIWRGMWDCNAKYIAEKYSESICLHPETPVPQ
jgi:hypothetical protein